MLGIMQDRPLLISSLIEHANHCHPHAEIVSRTIEGPIHRCTYADITRRAKQVANALLALGVKPGERIGTLAWNGYRHMELYFGVSGMGAVLHTINPRLFPEQIEYIANHAEDQYLFFDLTFAPLIEKLAPAMKTVKAFVAMTDRAHMPALKVANLLCYEELVEAQDSDYAWPTFDEHTASSLCYTSGTTGHPKGVLYSHRSTVLHSWGACTIDGLGLSSAESALLVVPMFHVNAWGMPYAGAMCGAKLVLPGAGLDGKSVYELMKDEKVTLALGVPTVWLMLFNHVDAAKLDPKQDLVLKRAVIGGSAAPRAMSERFERQFGTFVVHAWGMTEMSPLGSVCNLLPKHRGYTLAAAPRPAGQAGAGDLRRGDEDHRRRGPGAAARRGRLRSPAGARAVGHGRLFQGRGRADRRQRRLFRHRRRGHHRCRWLHADHRPIEGRDQVRRRMDFVDRSRERGHGPSGGGRGGGDRRRPSEVAGAPAAGGGEEGWSRAHARGAARRTWRTRWRNGGCPTTWRSSTSCRIPPPASCRR